MAGDDTESSDGVVSGVAVIMPPDDELPAGEVQPNLPFPTGVIPAPRRPRQAYLPPATRIDSAERLEKHLEQARQLGRAATLTGEQWVLALRHFGRQCAYCRTSTATVLEHFVPLEAGGGTTAGNCLPSCAPCNARKQDHGPAWIIDHWGVELHDRILAYLHERMTESDRAALDRFAVEPEMRAQDLIALVRELGGADRAAALLKVRPETLRRYAMLRTVPNGLAACVRETRARLAGHAGPVDVFIAEIEAERSRAVIMQSPTGDTLEHQRAGRAPDAAPTLPRILSFLDAARTGRAQRGDVPAGNDAKHAPPPMRPPQAPVAQQKRAKQLSLFDPGPAGDAYVARAKSTSEPQE